MDGGSNRPYLDLVEKLGVLHEHKTFRIATGKEMREWERKTLTHTEK